MAREKKLKKEDMAEDWCFLCKDGGTLVICDYKDCVKAYHSDCVSEDGSLMKKEEKWICDLHFCSKCDKPPKFYCLCCPFAICRACLYEAEFAIIKGDKGLCEECFEMAFLIEEKKDVDSNGCKINFRDTQTGEFYFYEYWSIVKRKECLTSEQFISAYNRLKSGESKVIASDSDEFDRGEEKISSKRKRLKGKMPKTKSLVKSKRKEFIGWRSKPLLEFLASIGKDTTQVIAKHAVATIISDYCKENNLFHPQKKNRIICDARLQALLGRKSLKKIELFKLLTTHLVENLDRSKDAFLCDEEDVSVACKTQMQSSLFEQSHSKEIASYQITNVQGAEPVGIDSGTNEQEHAIGIPESPPRRNSEDDLSDKEEFNTLLHWFKKRKRSNKDKSLKKDAITSEQPLQSFHDDLEGCADEQHAVPACKVYSRRNQGESWDSLQETSNGNGISCRLPSDQPELVNEVSIGIPCHVNYLPDASAAPPSSPPSTAVFQSEVPEASTPLTCTTDIIDDKDENIDLLSEGRAFFASLQPLLDENLERASQQPSNTISLSPGEIMEARSCLNKCCLMNFEQLMHQAERDQFFTTLDLLLKHGYFPDHMHNMVTSLQLKFSSNKYLYSKCQESVRRAEEEREHVESLKQELTHKYNLHKDIETEMEMVDEKIGKLINQLKDIRSQLCDARNSRKGLEEQSKSLKASSMASYDALCQYKQSSKTLDKNKQTGQQLMKDIDDFWNIVRTDILNLLVDMLP